MVYLHGFLFTSLCSLSMSFLVDVLKSVQTYQHLSAGAGHCFNWKWYTINNQMHNRSSNLKFTLLFCSTSGVEVDKWYVSRCLRYYTSMFFFLLLIVFYQYIIKLMKKINEFHIRNLSHLPKKNFCTYSKASSYLNFKVSSVTRKLLKIIGAMDVT